MDTREISQVNVRMKTRIQEIKSLKNQEEFKKLVITAYRDFNIAMGQEMLYNYVNKIISFSNILKLHITENQG